MPMLLPSLVFWEAFVWERGQAETGIADANILPLIGQNFGCDVDEGTLTFWEVLSSIAPGRSGWSDIRRPMIRPLPEDQRNAVRGV